ncbi:MAG: hypothetical protein ACREE5_04955, partial [Acetobacteraceae bacterium]
KHLDDVPLWRGAHVAVKQLVDDFARYLYLPRLAGPEVLLQSIRNGLALLTWRTDTFGYAESYDEATSRYRGLRSGQGINVSPDDAGLLVKPDIAARQLDAETNPPTGAPAASPGPGPGPGESDAISDPGSSARASSAPGSSAPRPATPIAPPLKRFHGSVRLDSARVGRDAGRIAEEVIAHLLGQMGAEVTVTLEIEARLPNGVTDQLARTVTENSRTLKFESHGFESE